jgi:hypothetical protein
VIRNLPVSECASRPFGRLFHLHLCDIGAIVFPGMFVFNRNARRDSMESLNPEDATNGRPDLVTSNVLEKALRLPQIQAAATMLRANVPL